MKYEVVSYQRRPNGVYVATLRCIRGTYGKFLWFSWEPTITYIHIFRSNSHSFWKYTDTGYYCYGFDIDNFMSAYEALYRD